MGAKNPKEPCQLNFTAVIAGLILLAVIALSSLTHTALALKENSQGRSDVVREQCLNGVEHAGVEVGVCSASDLDTFNNVVLPTKATQGIKAAKDICFSQITNPGCRGLCVAAINCFDLLPQ